MKKIVVVLVLALTLWLSMLALTACGEGDGEGVQNGGEGTDQHVHVFDEGKCECGATDPDYVTPHIHTSSDIKIENEISATCTKEGSYDEVVYCTVCSAELSRVTKTVDAVGHTEVIDEAVAPTCTETGLTAGKHCSVCEAILEAQTVVDALGHTEGAVVVENNIAPDCVNAGSYDNVVYCTVCSAELSREKITVNALGHTEVIDEAVAPTCTETGLTAGKHCSVCEAILEAQTVVDALGHTEGAVVVGNNIAPDCVNAGSYDNVVYCTVCSDELSREKVTVDALGHTEIVDEAVAPTCTETGLTAGKHCSVCEAVLEAQTVVDALGHKEVIDDAVAPTCTESGLTAGKHCFVCDAVIEEQTVVDALGHSEGAVVVENNNAPDCVNAGYYENVVYCTVCSAELSREEIVVPALGHRESAVVVENSIAPDCVNAGYYENVVYCTVCAAELSREKIIVNALGHTHSITFIENRVDPDCINSGSFESVIYCTVCSIELSREKTTVDVLGHTVVVDEAIAPTCTEPGLTEGKHCSICEEVLVAQEIIDAIGHTEVIDEAVEPTCTEAGLTEGKHCSVCEETIVAQTVLKVLNHDLEHHDAQAPSCTEIGWEAYDTCKRNGCEYTTYAEKDAIGHSYDDGIITTEATCTEKGIKTFTCITCRHTYQEDIAIRGHNWNSTVIKPTATENGLFEYVCSVCGYYYCEDLIPSEFTVTSSNRSQVGYTSKYVEKLFIPAVFKSGDTWYRVTSIGSSAFKNCTSLTSITIPDCVTSIGSYAFYQCTGLTSVTIGNSVTSIGERAFYNCTSLTSVTVGNGVTSVGNYAFYGCTCLEEIYFNATAMDDLSSSNYVFYNAGKNGNSIKVVIGKNVTKIPAYLFYPYSSSYSPKIVSVEFEEGSVCESIGNYAFAYCTGLASVTIPDNITYIGSCAFYDCTGLTSVTIGNGVKSIGSCAFYDCTGLTSVTIPDNVTYIGHEAFRDCTGLTSVTIGNGVTSIDSYAFYGCNKLVEVVNNSSLSIKAGSSGYGYVGYYAIEVHTGESKIVNYNDYLFYTYNGVNYLLGYAGEDKALVLPESYNGENYEIYKYAFYKRDDITSVVIPDSVCGLGEDAFRGCTSLTSMTIGNGVTSIGKEAFYSCGGLKSVIIPDSVTSIGGSAFSGCTGLTSVTIGNGVTSIGDYAFCGCTGLTSITIPDSVTSIGKEAFYSCGGLKSVIIPDSVTSIGVSAFSYCGGLKSVTIGNGVKSIDKSAFLGCDSLTSVTIGNNVISIGNYAFNGCNNLTSIKYRGTEEQWKAISKGSYWSSGTGNYTITYNYSE